MASPKPKPPHIRHSVRPSAVRQALPDCNWMASYGASSTWPWMVPSRHAHSSLTRLRASVEHVSTLIEAGRMRKPVWSPHPRP